MRSEIEPVAYDQMDVDWLPGFRPYPYQWEVYRLVEEALARRETLCILLVTPTGSGKTLASYAYSIRTGIPVLGVYPTNELIQDQERALAPEYKRCQDWQDWVLRVDSRKLDEWGLDLDLSRHGETLETLLNWRRVVLTNPDILYYIIFGRYPALPGQRERLFRLMADGYSLFVFDEFHLYTVKQVANVAFLVGMLHRINPARGRVFIFASATPESQIVACLRDRIGLRVEVVEGNPSTKPDACIIAYPVEWMVVPADLGRWKGLDAFGGVINQVDHFLQNYPQGRLVSIFDSVAGSIGAARLFRQRYPTMEIGEVHGFSSAVARESATRRQVTVGTSTIEVGVDFRGDREKDFLIFEARTANQFIQRFGRIARHQKSVPTPNYALALVPSYVYQFLAERAGAGQRLTRDEIRDLVREAYAQREAFERYLHSHAPVEMYAGVRFVRGLFQPDDWAYLGEDLEQLIPSLTDKPVKRAVGQYYHYERKGILSPLLMFRGAGFEIALLDERGEDPGLPAKRYDLMFPLRRGVFEEISEEIYLKELDLLEQTHPEWAGDIVRERRYAKRIERGSDQLLGVFGYFRLEEVLDEARRVWFELGQEEVQGRKGEVCVISGLQVQTEPPVSLGRLNRLLRRKQIVAWFMDVHPTAIRLGRALPPLFAVYELRVRLPGGRCSDQVWSIAFNQHAFFLSSLPWDLRDDNDVFIV